MCKFYDIEKSRAADADKGTQGQVAWIGYPLLRLHFCPISVQHSVRYLVQANVQPEDIRYKQISGTAVWVSDGVVDGSWGKYPTYWNIGGGGHLGWRPHWTLDMGNPPQLDLGNPLPPSPGSLFVCLFMFLTIDCFHFYDGCCLFIL